MGKRWTGTKRRRAREDEPEKREGREEILDKGNETRREGGGPARREMRRKRKMKDGQGRRNADQVKTSQGKEKKEKKI